MTNPMYAVVQDYATVPIYENIVAAVYAPGFALTGLTVDVQEYDLDGRSTWEALDALEAGYDRIKVRAGREEVFMYVQPADIEAGD